MQELSMKNLTRREFAKSTTLLAAAAMLPACSSADDPPVHGTRGLRAGVIGCGGRGTGAAGDFLAASPETEIVALADLFPERVKTAEGNLKELGDDRGRRVNVSPDHQFSGFDA